MPRAELNIMARRISLCLALAAMPLTAGCANTQPAASAAASCPFCSRDAHPSAASQMTATMPTRPPDLASAQTTGMCLYNNTDSWQTDSGQFIHLSDLRGRPRVIAMFFSTCQGFCAVTLEHLLAIDASLPPAIRDRTGFVLVTFDPAHDTARMLAAYRAEHNLPADRWTLLRGTPQSTAALANALQTRYTLDAPRGIVHTAEITVLDDAGNIIERQPGLHPDLARASDAVANAAR